jgi:hypothetical protein
MWPGFKYDSMDDYFKQECEISNIIPVQAELDKVAPPVIHEDMKYKNMFMEISNTSWSVVTSPVPSVIVLF